MPIHDLKDQIARLPEQPGVYLYYNAEGDTIYVGKARALRDRVRTYLGPSAGDPKTDALLQETVRLEVIVTDSVVEALALENNLIKQRSPKYNILLRDDKNYPYLQLTTNEAFPRLLVARRVERDASFYAGPFLPATFARKTIALTHRLFGIRSCNEVITGKRGRPCLEYDIKRCIAPCVDTLCSPAEYGRAVKLTELFLAGRNDELTATLKARMAEAAEAERFEEAAQLRDALRTVQTLRDRQQKMATAELGHRDVFGVKAATAGAIVHVFQIRGGRVVERVELVAESPPRSAPPPLRQEPSGGPGAPGAASGERAGESREGDVLEAALQQFYELRGAPPEIHVPMEPAEREAIETWLSEREGRRVRILVPQRGEKRGLVDLASRNAALAWQTQFDRGAAGPDRALAALQASLALPTEPRRIECFDVSTIQGRETVASMVVCEGGRMRQSEYRKYRVRGQTDAGAAGPRQANDDFGAMREVVLRRYRGLLERGGPFPDLVLIDGGKGQLSAAYDALQDLGLANLIAVGLAKKEELVYIRDSPDPIVLAPHDPGLLLLQRARDEAHRFAVTFHRRRRAMGDLRSVLDEVPGIGARRRRTLLTAFGSAAGVRRASREELAAIVGPAAADRVLAFFARRP